MAPASHSDVLGLGWLVQPRWGAVAAFLVALALSQLGLGQPMDPVALLTGAAVTALSNALAPSLERRFGMPRLAVSVLLFDTVLLSAVLYATGGASNPLTALYMIPIAMGALMLPRSSAWILSGAAVIAFGALFFVPGADHAHHAMASGSSISATHHASPRARADVFDLHLRGMWMAFTLTAVLVTYFVTRVATALRARDEQLVRTRARADRAERVASLAGLAASTAHELGTPLASISLAASEMRQAIDRGAKPATLGPDVDIVRGQIKRCREILDSMLSEAGETVGEAPSAVGARELVNDAIGMLPDSDRPRVTCQLAADLPVLRIPRRLVAQSLHNLLRNAVDASPLEASVELAAALAGPRIRFTVRDWGVGMDEPALADAMEPFVSTKPGRGHGLGLFLTRAVADRLGGGLQISSEPGRGTTAVFEILAETLATS